MTLAASVRPMNESDLSVAVLDMAHLFGWRGFHSWSSLHSPAGFPDWVFVRDGRIIFAELKRENGKVSAKQQEWLDLLRGCMVEVHLWRPAQLDDGTIERTLRG